MPFKHTVEDNYGRALASLVDGCCIYVFENAAQLYIQPKIGWCNGCSQFVFFETLPAPEKIEAEAAALLQRDGDPTLDVIKTHQYLLEGAEQWRIALQQRRSPPRCLECGGTDHVPLAEAGVWTQLPGGQSRRVRIRKEFCRVKGAFKMRHYDPEDLEVE